MERRIESPSMTDDAHSGSGFDMEESFDVRWRHVLKFTSDAFAVENPALADALADATDRAADRLWICCMRNKHEMRQQPPFPRHSSVCTARECSSFDKFMNYQINLSINS